jgi:hypothetical protein
LEGICAGYRGGRGDQTGGEAVAAELGEIGSAPEVRERGVLGEEWGAMGGDAVCGRVWTVRERASIFGRPRDFLYLPER